MMRKLTVAAAVALTALSAIPARASSQHATEAKVAWATRSRRQAEGVVERVLRRLETLTDEYQRIQGGLKGAAADLKLTYKRHRSLGGQLVVAQQDLNGEAARVYQAGPGTALELLLAAESTSDLADIGQFANRSLEIHNQTIERVQWLKSASSQTAVLLQNRISELRDSAKRLQDLAGDIFSGLDRAQAIAVQAGLADTQLLEKERAFQELTAQAANSLTALVAVSSGSSEAALLSLLGPTGGRTCAIPSGLRQTGSTMSGQASYYGWSLAGRHTASGAVFDPRLFTAAHKTLPLGTFLRVQYGGRCAVVLVNDRGPYVGSRIIDLSQGVAEWLGIIHSGVGYVTAEVLVPG